MADKKISALTAATTPLTGAEVLPIVQSGATVKVPVSDLTADRAVSLGSATVAGNLTVNTNTLYANSTANEVCVGTTTAINVGKFNVKGDSAHNGISATPYANGYYNYFGTNAAGTQTFYIRGDGISYFGGEMTVAGQLNNTGNHVITSGNIVPATAAKGINFTANSAAAGMTSQLLNWYEEGTWTPAVSGMTITNMTGTYTRIGNVVVLVFSMDNSTVSGTPNYDITGIPFTNGSKRCCAGVAYDSAFNEASTTTLAVLPPNSSTISLLNMSATGGWNESQITTGSARYVSFVLTYRV